MFKLLIMKTKLALLTGFLFFSATSIVLGQDSFTNTTFRTPTPKPSGFERPATQFFVAGTFSPKPTFSPRPSFSPKPTFSPRPGFRLTDVKLRSCEAREDAIKKRNESLLKMVANMLGKFDAIVTRVKEFYTNNLLPNGKIVPDYDALVSDIDAKKAAVESALAAVPDTQTFDCSSDDPKGLMTDFREEMKAVKDSLHAYRTSIKNLITAIHRVAGTPKPAPTPTP